MTIEINLPSGHIALVDECDADLAELKWSPMRPNGKLYANARLDGKPITLHRLILGRMLGRPLSRGEICDHVDGNGLNNNRSNLRLASQGQNLANSVTRSDSKSGVKGIRFHKQSGLWAARITHKGICYSLGYHPTPEAAHHAYMTAALELYGEFAFNGVRS